MPPETAVVDPNTEVIPPIEGLETPALPPPKQISPDDDPNLKLQQMVSRRKEAKPVEPPKPEDKKQAPEEPVTGDSKKLSGLIGKALGFREDKTVPDPDKKAPEKPKEPESKTVKEPEKPKEEPPKTIVKPKKPEKQPVQAQDLAAVAASAATAAVRAVMPEMKGQPAVQSKPEDVLTAGDLHEFEVAGFLGATNPKYKDAQKVILEHAKKADAYATSWEASNKGKVFDPEDDEHDEFYTALKKPWSDAEFHSAEIEMTAEKATKKISEQYDRKIADLEMESARGGLAGVVERTVAVAAVLLAKKTGNDIYDRIAKNNFENFSEEDPITANALAEAVGQLKPLIETAIQLDDPKARFKFNPDDEIHREWNRLMLEKESQFAGVDDHSGKRFATRSDFAKMGATERSKHWYLTTEHLIESLVEDASETVKSTVEKEKERQTKIALSLGFVPREDSSKTKDKPDATKNGKAHKEEEPKPDSTKPASPASGGGAKVDDRAAGNPAGTHKLLETTASILFRR